MLSRVMPQASSSSSHAEVIYPDAPRPEAHEKLVFHNTSPPEELLEKTAEMRVEELTQVMLQASEVFHGADKVNVQHMLITWINRFRIGYMPREGDKEEEKDLLKNMWSAKALAFLHDKIQNIIAGIPQEEKQRWRDYGDAVKLFIGLYLPKGKTVEVFLWQRKKAISREAVLAAAPRVDRQRSALYARLNEHSVKVENGAEMIRATLQEALDDNAASFAETAKKIDHLKEKVDGLFKEMKDVKADALSIESQIKDIEAGVVNGGKQLENIVKKV